MLFVDADWAKNHHGIEIVDEARIEADPGRVVTALVGQAVGCPRSTPLSAAAIHLGSQV